MNDSTIYIIFTICAVVLGTMLTRFTPFLVFGGKREAPAYVQYLGKALPGAALGLLVVYCLKDIELLSGSHGIPEFIALAATAALHLWRRNMLLSIADGTAVYMILVNYVF